jgi:hypothetical protein
MPLSNSKQLIGVPELAQALKLKRRTVADPKWRAALGLPFYQINARCVRFDLTEVLAHLKRTTHHSPNAEEASK